MESPQSAAFGIWGGTARNKGKLANEETLTYLLIKRKMELNE